jgi:hypothetical protein
MSLIKVVFNLNNSKESPVGHTRDDRRIDKICIDRYFKKVCSITYRHRW